MSAKFNTLGMPSNQSLETRALSPSYSQTASDLTPMGFPPPPCPPVLDKILPAPNPAAVAFGTRFILKFVQGPESRRFSRKQAVPQSEPGVGSWGQDFGSQTSWGWGGVPQ